jgi:hypothetical protein
VTQVTTGKAAPPGSASSASIDFPATSTKNSTYTTVGTFGFAGSNEIGVPSVLRAIIGVEDATSLDARVQDITNNQTIAEVTGVTDAFPTIVNLGTISNVPTGAAVWELQIRRNTGTGNQQVRASSLALVY